MFSSRILIIDDEEIIRQLLCRTLGEDGYVIETAQDGQAALEKIKGEPFNLLITDLKMPKVDGMDVLKEIKKVNPYIEVIIITGYPTVEAAVEAIKIGAFDFICKPFDIKEMKSTVKRCLEKQEFTMNRIELSELMAFFAISKTITAHTNFDSLLERILDYALDVVKAKKGALLLFDQTAKELKIKVSRGLSDDAILNEKIIAIYNKAINEKKPVAVSDNGIKWLLSVPLVTKYFDSTGEVIGVINIADKISGEQFSEREETLLSVLAGQAVAAIENYRLFSQLQDKIKVLEHTINELDETQNQLIQTEKLAAVGQLAFGIAHEIRNPLGIILSGVEFLKTNIVNKDIEEAADIAVGKIKQSIDRANNIIVDLLKFSRASKLQLSAINISQLMDEAVSLVKNQAYLHNVRIKTNYQNNIFIDADSNMMRQVFFNLFINAIDAMPKGGELNLSLFLGQDMETKGDQAIVEVFDAGEGISREILLKIFDPFFTTKEPGKGTGLGLSIVHLILERHNGTINVESEINKGTKFTIRLPLRNADKQE